MFDLIKSADLNPNMPSDNDIPAADETAQKIVSALGDRDYGAIQKVLRSFEAGDLTDALEDPDAKKYLNAIFYIKQKGLDRKGPDVIHQLDLNTDEGRYALAQFQRLFRLAVVRRLQSSDQPFEELKSVLRKALAPNPNFTEQDIHMIMESIRDSGININVPQLPEQKKSSNLYNFFMSLSPLAKVAVLAGIPITLVGAYQMLTDKISGRSVGTTLAGILLFAMGLYHRDQSSNPSGQGNVR